MTPDARIPAQTRGEAQVPLGWPWSAMQGGQTYLNLWHRHFGAGLRRRIVETTGPDAARLDLVHSFSRRRASLGTRFIFCPADLPFVAEPERRLIPLRQLSCPIALEAGNLRGGLHLAAGADMSRALAGLAQALAAQRGWDYATLPVPASQAALWSNAAAGAGMPVLLRPTGRAFHACLSGQSGWALLRDACSRNDRKNQAKALRRAEDAGLRLVTHSGAAALAAMPQLRQVADQSTKSIRLAGAPVQVPYTARQEAFLRDLMASPSMSGLLIVLDSDTGPLAASLWLRAGSDLLGTVTFHTEAARSFSPGLLLMREAFLWAQSNRVERLDFNATDPLYAAYSDAIEPWFDLLLFPNGWRGRMLHRLAAARDPGLPQPIEVPL